MAFFVLNLTLYERTGEPPGHHLPNYVLHIFPSMSRCIVSIMHLGLGLWLGYVASSPPSPQIFPSRLSPALMVRLSLSIRFPRNRCPPQSVRSSDVYPYSFVDHPAPPIIEPPSYFLLHRFKPNYQPQPKYLPVQAEQRQSHSHHNINVKFLPCRLSLVRLKRFWRENDNQHFPDVTLCDPFLQWPGALVHR